MVRCRSAVGYHTSYLTLFRALARGACTEYPSRFLAANVSETA